MKSFSFPLLPPLLLLSSRGVFALLFCLWESFLSLCLACLKILCGFCCKAMKHLIFDNLSKTSDLEKVRAFWMIFFFFLTEG